MPFDTLSASIPSDTSDLLLLAGILSGALSTLAYLPCAIDTLADRTNPQRASWLIWSILGGIAFFSQLYEGATHSLLFADVQINGTALIFSVDQTRYRRLHEPPRRSDPGPRSTRSSPLIFHRHGSLRLGDRHLNHPPRRRRHRRQSLFRSAIRDVLHLSPLFRATPSLRSWRWGASIG